MDTQRYTLPEDKSGKVAEPAVAFMLPQNDYFHDVETIEISQEERTLTREEGEQLLRDTLVPALRDVKEAERRGERLPDISELFKELEEMEKQEQWT